MQQSNFQRVSEFFQICGKGQTVANASTQIGCRIEEIVEFLATLSISDNTGAASRMLACCADDLNWLAGKIKSGQTTAYVLPHNREACLDALCDADFTGNGVAYLLDMKKDAADTAVIDSCFDKLIDGKPVLLPGGKIGKRQGWVAPSLKEFV